VAFVPADATLGIADPVTVTLPIGGLGFTPIGTTTPRTTWLMDCELALALRHAADVMKAHDVTRVEDYGLYNYRCIDQTVQPPCPGSTLSMHAHALAVDLAAFTTTDGARYSVNDDFLVDAGGVGVARACAAPAAPRSGKDAWLHELVCDLHAHEIFFIELTPDYNAAHRDHFHVDLTPGADFVHRRAGAADE
jgi:hypothetical protein